MLIPIYSNVQCIKSRQLNFYTQHYVHLHLEVPPKDMHFMANDLTGKFKPLFKEHINMLLL